MKIKDLRIEALDKGCVVKYCEETAKGNMGSNFPEMSRSYKEEAFNEPDEAVARFVELLGAKKVTSESSESESGSMEIEKD
jgi:hypothetical protein